MAALKLVKKWNYMKATEKDEEQFVDEEPDTENISLKDIKAAFEAFRKAVCVPEFPPRHTPQAGLASRALYWLLHAMGSNEHEEACQKDLFDIVMACVQAGPNTSHLEIIDDIIRQTSVDDYIETLKGEDFRQFLRVFAREYTFHDPDLSEQDYAEMLSSTLRMKIFNYVTDDQCEAEIKECAVLYYYLTNLDASGPISGVHRDVASAVERKCSDELEKVVNRLTPTVPWPEQLKEVEKAILNEPNMDESKASKLYDKLSKCKDYLKENPDKYLELMDCYMGILKALSKCPDNKSTHTMVEAIERISGICESIKKNKPELVEKYAPLLGEIIMSSPAPRGMAKAVPKFCEEFLLKASGQSPNQLPSWIPLISALVRVWHVKFLESATKILQDKKKYLKWKDCAAGALEIFSSINMLAAQEGDEDHDDSDYRSWLVAHAIRDFLEEFLKQLKSSNLLSTPDLQKFMLAYIQQTISRRAEDRVRCSDNFIENITMSSDKSMALPLIKTLDEALKEEEYPWHDMNATTLPFVLLNKIVECHRRGKEFKPYNDLYLSIFKTCMAADHWDHDDDSHSAHGYVLSSTSMQYVRLHSEDKTGLHMQPILGDFVKCVEHEDEDIASTMSSSLQILGMQEPDIFTPYTAQLMDVYLETKKSNILSILSSCYRKNPKPINAKLRDLFEALEEADNSDKHSIMDLITKIGQGSPGSFTQEDVDKLVTGGYMDNMMTAGSVLTLIQSLAAKYPEKFEKHLDYLMSMMTDLTTMSMIPTILIEISKLNKKYPEKVFRHLVKLMKSANGDYTTIAMLLNPIRIIGLDHLDLLKSERQYMVWIKENVVQLREFANHIIDVIDGKSVDNINDILGQQQNDLNALGIRVTTTENEVSELGEEVGRQGQQVGELRQEVDSQGERLDDLGAVVDDTVLKVEEIDNKTLNNAPTWSRDISKLLNPEADHDWRLLAQRLGYSPEDIRGWATQHDPCMSFLSEWFATHKTSEATKAVLKTLEEMNRLDAAEIVGRALQAVENIIQDEPPDYENPPPIFISYQWGHQPEVRLLRKHLEMAGFESWMDIGQMGGGDKLYAKIDEGIRAAKAVICCVTDKYAKSPNCNREVNLAVNLGKPIIPILLENVSWPPPGAMGPIFGEYLYIRFFTRQEEAKVKDETFWPPPSFRELLMQLCYMKLIPEEDKVAKVYKNWWLPPDEKIVIPKRKPQEKSSGNSSTVADKEKSQESPDVFISYQWGIQPQVRSLYKRLSELGFHCWMDIFQMGGGDSLYDKIDRGVRGSKVVVSCVTEKYAKSANCRREVSLADAVKRPIIPLLMEQTTWPPSGPMSMVFTQLLYIQFTDPKLQETWTGPKFEELLEKLRLNLPKLAHGVATKVKAAVPEKQQEIPPKRPPQAPAASANSTPKAVNSSVDSGSRKTPSTAQPTKGVDSATKAAISTTTGNAASKQPSQPLNNDTKTTSSKIPVKSNNEVLKPVNKRPEIPPNSTAEKPKPKPPSETRHKSATNSTVRSAASPPTKDVGSSAGRSKAAPKPQRSSAACDIL